MKFIVRSIPTNKRGRAAIIATTGIDDIWLQNASPKEIMKFEHKLGIIGSVDIIDCINVGVSGIENKIINLAGKKYWDYYPKYLIPTYKRNKTFHIWVIENPKSWKKSVNIKGGGIIWSKIDIKDR